MSTQSRPQLLKRLLLEGKKTGNLDILLTNAIAARIGLGATDYECYSLLLDRGPTTAGDLAAACGITTGGLTGLVDRLEKLGLVERIADPSDRRKVLVRAKGNRAIQAKLDKLYTPMVDGFVQLNALYTDEQLELLLIHAGRVNKIMQDCLHQLSGKN
ncbi:MAG TPA: MarR family transcriptional regulator [Magnetospirillaceae bacterium]|nr:MarR family transcriptional regulator [Magnetospirillaceae bacterium]